MILKGLKKGSNDLRKFTFDDNEYIQKDGHFYYKVNYGKNLLEGEYAEDEIGYVDVTQVITLGGKKPKPIPELEMRQYMPPTPTPQVEVKPEPKKRGRPAKVNKIEPSQETIQVAPMGGVETFEYLVTSLKVETIPDLQFQLNEKGKEGWELCGFDSNKTLFGSIQFVCIFKRKRG